MAEPQWNTVEVGIPVSLTASADALNNIIEFLISILNIALQVLEVVRALLIGLLNPIRAIIEAIIAEIEAFLNDLRQLGIYVTWDSADWPFDDLLGGFPAYRGRMFGKLTNITDPTRPNFSDRSAAIGVFIYASADPTAIYVLIGLIMAILRLFGLGRRPRQRSLAVPTGLSATYGPEFAGLASFGSTFEVLMRGEDPAIANLRWTLAPPPGPPRVLPFLPCPPQFLIEVSTRAGGFGIAYSTAKPSSQVDALGQQNQTFGVIVDEAGEPYRLFGGATELQTVGVEDEVSGNTYRLAGVGSDGTLNGNNVTVYAFDTSADSAPTPLSAVGREFEPGKFLFQRTFVYDVSNFLGINLSAPGQPFTARLRAEDMPYDATVVAGTDGEVEVIPAPAPAREVFVRIRSAGAGYESDPIPLVRTRVLRDPVWTLDASKNFVSFPVQLGMAKADQPFSEPSEVLAVSFPAAGTAQYLETVTVALILMVLSRPDLTPIIPTQDVNTINEVLGFDGEVTVEASIQTVEALVGQGVVDKALVPTGLEPLVRRVFPKLQAGLGKGPPGIFQKSGDNAQRFRRGLVAACRAVAQEIVDAGGVPSDFDLRYLQSASEVTLADGRLVPLREATWGDFVGSRSPYLRDSLLGRSTVLESFDGGDFEDGGVYSGVAPNPLSVDRSPTPERTYAKLLNLNTGRETQAVTLRRSPGFVLNARGQNIVSYGIGQGSADMSPVLYVGPEVLLQGARGGSLTTSEVVFVRNAMHYAGNAFAAVALVLDYATRAYTVQPGGAWVAMRLFPNGIPPIDEFLQRILDFLNAVLDGLQGIIDLILAYIGFIEARILDLEALLRRIQALLNLVLSLNLEVPVSALVVDGNGTLGLAQGLMTARSAPEDSPASFGFGVAIVAGGVPRILLDIIKLLFPPR
jgi:hypothetical protein